MQSVWWQDMVLSLTCNCYAVSWISASLSASPARHAEPSASPALARQTIRGNTWSWLLTLKICKWSAQCKKKAAHLVCSMQKLQSTQPTLITIEHRRIPAWHIIVLFQDIDQVTFSIIYQHGLSFNAVTKDKSFEADWHPDDSTPCNGTEHKWTFRALHVTPAEADSSQAHWHEVSVANPWAQQLAKAYANITGLGDLLLGCRHLSGHMCCIHPWGVTTLIRWYISHLLWNIHKCFGTMLPSTCQAKIAVLHKLNEAMTVATILLAIRWQKGGWPAQKIPIEGWLDPTSMLQHNSVTWQGHKHQMSLMNPTRWSGIDRPLCL